MKYLSSFFIAALCLTGFTSVGAEPLSGTAGSNLTSYNGTMGSINNNQWNNLQNERNANANFGNCNAVILRCAQPKCATGGCTSMDIAYPIVQGCVLSNNECKGHGESLIQSIAAQLVASSTAKANQNAANASAAAANAAAASSAQQIQMMQQQIEQMQYQSQQQSASTAAAVEAALAEQKILSQQTAQQQIDMASAAAAAAAPAQKIEQAVKNNVSAEVLVREQAGNRILSQLENSEDALKVLKKTMQNVFDYAKCDSSGNYCEGPARVAVFKSKANDFFDPYNDVLDEVYDALILAQSLGVDITDIYMMLNDTCNVWGTFLCRDDTKDGDEPCELLEMITDKREVQEKWMDNNTNKESNIVIKCASTALDESKLFKNRRKSSNIGIDLLRQIIEQDSPTYGTPDAAESMKYCFDANLTKSTLEKQVTQKRYPDNICTNTHFTRLSNDIDDDTGMCPEFINSDFALCTTHAYNSGLDENSDDQNEMQENKEIIALKATLMTQEMNKQFNFLESTMGRFKTQLEKAILTAQMEAAGAADEESSGGYSSTLTGIMECGRRILVEDKTDCLMNNYEAVGYATNYGEKTSTAAKKQLATDYETAFSLADSLKIVDEKAENKQCISSSGMSTTKKFQECLTIFGTLLGTIKNNLTSQANKNNSNARY